MLLHVEHLSDPAVGGGGDAGCGNGVTNTLPLRVTGAQEYAPAHRANAVGIQPGAGSPPDILPIPCIRWVPQP